MKNDRLITKTATDFIIGGRIFAQLPTVKTAKTVGSNLGLPADLKGFVGIVRRGSGEPIFG